MPSRRRDVIIPLPGAGPKPAHPLKALDGAGKRKGRRRRAPEPEDPRDTLLLEMLRHVQGLNASVAELAERLQLSLIEAQILRRRIERLEARVLEATWTPPGATDTPEPDRSDVEVSVGP